MIMITDSMFFFYPFPKYVFNHVEFVDQNNMEAQNPRRDTSIPKVSAGLSLARLQKVFILVAVSGL